MHRPIDLKKKKETILLRAIVIPRSQAWMIHLNLSFKGTKLARFIIYHSNSSNSILINHSATRVQITRDSKNKIKRWNEKGGYKKKKYHASRSFDIFISVITIFEACPSGYRNIQGEESDKNYTVVCRYSRASPWKVNFPPLEGTFIVKF